MSVSASEWRARDVWHVCVDQGPKSWTSLAWLQSVHARMTATGDILHRLANDVCLAYSHSGLTPTKLEY
eukprot:5125912-Amphidinium_carterae.1